jgi:polyphenol oxidase
VSPATPQDAAAAAAAASGRVIEPGWNAPPGVGALMSTRQGGVSVAPWQRLNLGTLVGDDPGAVTRNRSRWARQLGAQPIWLNQVHGAGVVRIGLNSLGHDPATADAAWTDQPGVACTVLVADCLPVLFASCDGRAVAAAHAGWRGLVGGVLEATLAALHEGAGAAPQSVLAWLGPCIGPREFEVGADVLEAFGAARQADLCFVSRPRPDGSPRWLADLQALARARLAAAGVRQVHASGLCTVEDGSRFFSFRRDGRTGRMAASVWLR